MIPQSNPFQPNPMICSLKRSIDLTNTPPKVNPDVLGGLIVEIGADRTIDLSVANRIAKMNKLLTDAL